MSDLKLSVSGNVITSNYEDVLNLSIKGKDMNIKSVLSMLPDKYKKSVNDNNLKISGLKLDDMEVDSLPLTTNMDFKMDLTGSDGNYIYFQYTFPRLVFHHRINATNSADYKINFGPQGEYGLGEIFTINGAALYIASGYENDTEWWPSNLNPGFRLGLVDVNPLSPVACVYASGVGNVYALVGGESLVRCDDFTLGTSTIFNMGIVFADVAPMRLRLHPNGTDLYIACQNKDVIIIWDTVSNTGIYKDGFSSPIDVVFTASKIWAVQSGIQSLKEII